MRRYTATQAREHLSDILNAAERGQDVVIERWGVRFLVRADRQARRWARGESIFAYVDPAVIEGQWTWTWGRRGLRFARRGRGQ